MNALGTVGVAGVVKHAPDEMVQLVLKALEGRKIYRVCDNGAEQMVEVGPAVFAGDFEGCLVFTVSDSTGKSCCFLSHIEMQDLLQNLLHAPNLMSFSTVSAEAPCHAAWCRAVYPLGGLQLSAGAKFKVG